MKKMKRFVALALSVVMVLAMSVMAFADDNAGSGTTPSTGSSNTYTITAPATNHQYEIYQIFTGDLHGDVLSNIKWGQNGKGTLGEAVDQTVIAALTAVNSSTDTAKLAVIKNYATLTNPVATITNGATYTVHAGYYLIKDKDNSITGTSDSYTLYIVEVVGNMTIIPKADVPSFEKKIKDTNDTDGTTSEWQDSADYDIGDAVPFKLEGTVGQRYGDYKHYYFAFHDKEEAGLTFNKDSVKVYVDNNEITSGYNVVTNTTDGCTFEVVFEDLKALKNGDNERVHAGSKIRVEYTSILNENASLGKPGNVNEARLEFSNNPNSEQIGKPDDTGKTPWDNVIVFTYKVVVNKYANSVDNANKLTGAEFTLEKVLENGNKQTIRVVKSEDGTRFTFKGLDDGKYVLTETTTPNGYNTIAPIEFTVAADHTITWDGDKATTRNTVLTSLTGTAASGEITFTANENKDELSTNVINKSGSILPSTGGIGTTIFYIVGGILMVGAAVLLITKRRAEN